MWYNYLIYCALCAAIWGFYYLGKRKGREERQRELDDFGSYEEFCDPYTILNNKKEEEYQGGKLCLSGFEGYYDVKNIRVNPVNSEVSFVYCNENILYALNKIEQMMCSEEGKIITNNKRDIIFECGGVSTTFYNAMLVEHNHEEKFVRMKADWIA